MPCNYFWLKREHVKAGLYKKYGDKEHAILVEEHFAIIWTLTKKLTTLNRWLVASEHFAKTEAFIKRPTNGLRTIAALKLTFRWCFFAWC